MICGARFVFTAQFVKKQLKSAETDAAVVTEWKGTVMAAEKSRAQGRKSSVTLTTSGAAAMVDVSAKR